MLFIGTMTIVSSWFKHILFTLMDTEKIGCGLKCDITTYLLAYLSVACGVFCPASFNLAFNDNVFWCRLRMKDCIHVVTLPDSNPSAHEQKYSVVDSVVDQ